MHAETKIDLTWAEFPHRSSQRYHWLAYSETLEAHREVKPKPETLIGSIWPEPN
jgi:hypothetical protein